MPLFYDLDGLGADTARVADRLATLRTAMQNHPAAPERSVPGKNTTDTLLLATWNIKEFDGGDTDKRTDESYWYIAEIISHFDLVAIQEVGANLDGLEKLKNRLGGTWRYVVSDVTEGKAGNYERLAFLFDRRKVRFSGVAGEIVIPPVEDAHGNRIAPADQLARTPTIVGFEAGWFRFMLSTVHIIWGKGDEEHPARVAEIQTIAAFLKDRSEDVNAWSHNMFLLGDFNIFMDGRAEDDPQNRLSFNTKGVPRTEDQRRVFYRNHWRRRQMSDHLPMWLELKIDFGANYLQKRFGM